MRVAHVFGRTMEDKGSLLMFADVMFGDNGGNGLMTVRGFKLMKGQDGSLWVAEPSEKAANGEWYPKVSYAKDKEKNLTEEAQELRNNIKNALIAEYEKQTEGTPKTKNKAPRQTTNEFSNDFEDPFA